MPNSLWTLPEILNLFGDEMLHPLDRYEEDVQGQFFIQRLTESRQLEAQIDQVDDFGGNLLLVGDPGTGKSSFITWFLKHSDFIKQNKPWTTTIDLKGTGGTIDKELFSMQTRARLLDSALGFIESEVGDPCHEIPRSKDVQDGSAVALAYDKAMRRLLGVTDAKHRKLYLFVDDIDYIDHSLFPIITSHLKPFLMSRVCCVILAVRRPAENAIRHSDDFMIGQFFDKTTIPLSHLEVTSLIHARMAATVKAKDMASGNSVLHRFWKQLSELLVNEDGTTVVAESTPLLPFTAKQLTFIQDCSNGNIREMLQMAQAYLSYMARHSKELQRDSYGRLIVGRDRLINGITDGSTQPSIVIYNLHDRKSHDGISNQDRRKLNVPPDEVGNSLYVVLLETLRDFRSLNATQIRRLTRFGFSEAELKEGIADLYSMGMIEEVLLEDQRALGDRIPAQRDYTLFRKGHYYVDYMIHWDEYIARFGRSRHHELGGAPNAGEFIRRSLLQFLAAIRTIVSADVRFIGPGYAKVSKEAFTEAFCRLGAECLIWANWNDKVTPIDMDSGRIENILKGLKVIREHGLDGSRYFLINFDRVRTQCQDHQVKLGVHVPFFLSDVEEFVAKHVFPVDDVSRAVGGSNPG